MSKIDIKVKGRGTMNVGNIAQGKNVRIESGDINISISAEALKKELLTAVREAAEDESAGIDDSRMKELEEEIEALSDAVTEKPANTGRIRKTLGLIKEHHEWAFPAIAAVFNRVAPILAGLF